MTVTVSRFAYAAVALSLAFAPASYAQTPPATPSAIAQPVEAPARFSVEVVGTGPDVILIPGLSSPREVWDGTRAALAGKYRLHILELAGFGGSDPAPNLTGAILPGVVDQLAAYIEANHLKSPAVIGHSMGGLIGLMLAKAHPRDVGRLMVVDSLPWFGSIFAPGANPAVIEPQVAAMRDAMAAQYGKPADSAAIGQVAAGLALKPESRATVATWMGEADARVSAQAMYEDAMTDLRADTASIAVPTTLVYPWSDALPKARADAFYRGEYAKVPDMHFAAIGDSAHFVMLDQPAAFATAVEGFLAAE